jgi:hypothetical protein
VGVVAVVLVGLGVAGAWLARRSTRVEADLGHRPAPEPQRAGIVQRLRERIDPPVPGDPDDWVVVADVLHFEGPLVQSAIEAAGIPAVLEPHSAVPGRPGPWDRQRVVVRRGDVPVAEEILAELRGR